MRIDEVIAKNQRTHGIIPKKTGYDVSEEFLTLQQVAERLHVTVDTVRVWIREGDLVAFKIGRAYLVKPDDLQKYIEERRTDRKDE